MFKRGTLKQILKNKFEKYCNNEMYMQYWKVSWTPY